MAKKKKIIKQDKLAPKYQFRQRVHKSIFESHNLKQCDLNPQGYEDDEDMFGSVPGWEKKSRRIKKKSLRQKFDRNQFNEDQGYQQKNIIDRLPQGNKNLQRVLNEVKNKIRYYKQQFLRQQQNYQTKISYVGQNSIPISTDITKFNFDLFIQKQLKFGGRQFDVIMMDPPWKLSSSQPSRGVAIQYDSLGDQFIQRIPIPKLQKNGFLMIWAINAKYRFTIDLLEKKWGYKVVDTMTWVKMTVNGKIAKGHGFYLQHAKQTCIIGIKGNPNYVPGVARDVIFSQRRGQSQKPTQIYDYVQQLVPNGYYLQLFGRRNNLRNNWVTIGNQI